MRLATADHVIEAGRNQTRETRSAADRIEASSIAGAEIVAAEIRQQTEELEDAICDATTAISHSVDRAADKIEAAIESVGDRICAELHEIRWQLEQVNQTLLDILHTLRESRNNEAQQLVQQGLRHYVNDEFEEAEERFLRALDFDTTDYQVLMNLGWIEVNKGNAQAAIRFFTKARTLPSSLSASAKVRAILAAARVHYQEREYDEARSLAHDALKLEETARLIYLTARYCARSGKRDEALELLETAIVAAHEYFAKAAIDEDFETIRREVTALLARLATQAQTAGKSALRRACADFKSLRTLEHLDRDKDHIGRLHEELKTGRVAARAEGLSYRDWLKIEAKSLQLIAAIETVVSLDQISSELIPLEAEELNASFEVDALESQLDGHQRRSTSSVSIGHFAWVGFAVFYVTPWVSWIFRDAPDSGGPIAGILFGWIWPVAVFYDGGWLMLDAGWLVSSALVGALLGVTVFGIACGVAAVRQTNRSALSEISRELRQARAGHERLASRVGEIRARRRTTRHAVLSRITNQDWPFVELVVVDDVA